MPGNGRFPGFGLIRFYSPGHIHVSFASPTVNRVFRDQEEVFSLLRGIVAGRASQPAEAIAA